MKREEIKNSFSIAVLFMGIACGTTFFLYAFQHILLLFPKSWYSEGLPWIKPRDLVNLFGGILFGMVVLPILEFLRILKVTWDYDKR